MRESSLSPTRIDPAHPRRDMLTSEARRLARRRAAALAVAARCRRFAAEAIDPHPAMTVSDRAMRRAAGLHVRFHRTLDALVDAGGFDEALAIVRERRCVTA
jgi:hypothetical protein